MARRQTMMGASTVVLTSHPRRGGRAWDIVKGTFDKHLPEVPPEGVCHGADEHALEESGEHLSGPVCEH